MVRVGSGNFVPAVVLGIFLAAGLAALPAAAQVHPSELPPLVPDGEFPRCTAYELVEVGFPDHKHQQYWPTWETPVDEAGRPYGPGSLCAGGEVIPRPDLFIEPDLKRYGPFTIQHSPVYRDCDIIQFVELLDWAWHEVPPLLGLTTGDRCHHQSGQQRSIPGADRAGHLAVLHPGRRPSRDGTLARPAAPHPGLGTRPSWCWSPDWLLRENFGGFAAALVDQGLWEYRGEHGQHLVNYMAQFRSEGPILSSPPIIDAVLSGGLDPEPQRDREIYRKACYGDILDDLGTRGEPRRPGRCCGSSWPWCAAAFPSTRVFWRPTGWVLTTWLGAWIRPCWGDPGARTLPWRPPTGALNSASGPPCAAGPDSHPGDGKVPAMSPNPTPRVRFAPSPTGTPSRGRGPHRPVQLAVRPQPGRGLRAAHRGHRPAAQHRRIIRRDP